MNVQYIEKVMKDPATSRASFSIVCEEDFHFIGAIYLDGKRLFSCQSSELDKILFEINDRCRTLLEGINDEQ